MSAKSWRLMQGDHILGTVWPGEVDMFWTDCRFEPGPGWATIRPLFDASRDAWLAHDLQAALTADERIRQEALVLAPDDGGELATDFVIRIHEDRARLKW
ncbi:hypothetical protein [Streptomyces sp. NPDC001781]